MVVSFYCRTLHLLTPTPLLQKLASVKAQLQEVTEMYEQCSQDILAHRSRSRGTLMTSSPKFAESPKLTNEQCQI